MPKISFGEQVFGLGSSIALDGQVKLAGGSLDASLGIKRLDGPGGALDLSAKYDKDSTRLDLDLGIDEPRGGIYGGDVAAPAFQRIAQFALPYLGIPPS